MSQILTGLGITEKQLQHSSSTVAGSAGFTRLDIATARVLVKRLVRSGLRKGPSEYLLLSDSVIEAWYDAEAITYLHEQFAAKCGTPLEIE